MSDQTPPIGKAKKKARDAEPKPRDAEPQVEHQKISTEMFKRTTSYGKNVAGEKQVIEDLKARLEKYRDLDHRLKVMHSNATTVLEHHGIDWKDRMVGPPKDAPEIVKGALEVLLRIEILQRILTEGEIDVVVPEKRDRKLVLASLDVAHTYERTMARRFEPLVKHAKTNHVNINHVWVKLGPKERQIIDFFQGDTAQVGDVFLRIYGERMTQANRAPFDMLISRLNDKLQVEPTLNIQIHIRGDLLICEKGA